MTQVDRRTMIKAAAAGAAAAAFPVMAKTPRRRPNFLFIMADDMGYADLSCYGREEYRTPAIDKLAAQGSRFLQAYANSAVCTATRVGLITGRYQYRVPIGLEEPLTNRPVGLPPEHPTLPSQLRRAGYATSLIGKWHMGALPKYGPLQSGYERFWGFRGGGVDYFSHKIGGVHDLWDGDVEVEQAGYLTDLIGERAIGVLEGHAADDRPFLMSLHFSAPHWPWEGLADQAVSERLSPLRNPMAMAHYDGGTMRTYAEMVVRLDHQVGRVLAALKRLKLDRDTVVVFTSDNGGERFSKTWPFSGRKSELLEGGIRVPTIVRWPGLSRPGSVSQAQIMSMDWMPTFLAAAGAAADPAFPLDGADIRLAIGGGALPERALFWRYKNQLQEAARIGDWKYLKIAGQSFLFNLADDPMERANLKLLQPERFAALAERWRRWNGTMLPLDPASVSLGWSGTTSADRYGTGH